MHKKAVNKKATTNSKNTKQTIDELNAYAKAYFKTHELPEHLKTVAGSVKAGNKTAKQLMTE